MRLSKFGNRNVVVAQRVAALARRAGREAGASGSAEARIARLGQFVLSRLGQSGCSGAQIMQLIERGTRQLGQQRCRVNLD